MSVDDIFPIKVQPNSGLTVPWREHIPDKGGESTSDSSWGYGDTHAGLVVDIYWKDLGKFIQEALGYSYDGGSIADGGDGNLHRVVPWRHPLFGWLWCNRISQIKGLKLKGKYDDPDHDPKFGLGYGTGPSADWHYARCVCAFSTLPYNVVDDTTLNNPALYNGLEMWRYMQGPLSNPGIQTLNLERGQTPFHWKETGAGGPTVDTEFTSPTSQVLPKDTFSYIWHQVPTGFVLDGKGRANNILSLIGCVNDSPFPAHNLWNFKAGEPQYAAGTLQVLPPKFDFEVAPVPPFRTGGLSTEPPLMLKITLNFGYFDPPTNATTHGHNLALFRGNLKWYKIVAADGATTIYPAKDITKIWQHV